LVNLEVAHSSLNGEHRRRVEEARITICDPNRAIEGADKVFQCIYDKAI